MAEFAAVGVASSILQIIDFASKTVNTARKLYVKDQKTLRDLTEMQRSVAKGLQLSLDSRSSLSANEQALVDLTLECDSQAGELLGLLDQLKLPTDSKGMVWAVDTAKIALRTTRKRDEIESRQERLHVINGHLATALLVVLR
jgi:hypothetical protein